jgi:hypothetical protein
MKTLRHYLIEYYIKPLKDPYFWLFMFIVGGLISFFGK